MKSFKNILLTTDFSQNANAALPYAVALARQFDGTIHLFHAIENEPLDAFAAGIVIGVSAWINARRKEYEQKMRLLAQDIETNSGVKAKGVCAAGHSVKEIVSYAKESADVIVIATHGRTGIQHLMLGSIAERVTRLSEVPVLTVRPGGTVPEKGFQFKTILLPTDFSANAAAAEPYAVDLAKLSNGKILLTHVVDDLIYYSSEASLALPSAEVIEQWVKTATIDADKRLAEKAARLSAESGVEVEPVRITGRVAEKLFDVIATRHVDLITISTHGFTGLSRLMYGSNAEKVIQESTVPVLSIKPPQSKVA